MNVSQSAGGAERGRDALHCLVARFRLMDSCCRCDAVLCCPQKPAYACHVSERRMTDAATATATATDSDIPVGCLSFMLYEVL